MRTVNSVAKIADPMKRAAAAATLVRDADNAAVDARATRDMATIVAHLDQGATPVTLYRALGISRGLFNRMVQRAPQQRPPIEDALAVATQAAKEVRKYERISAEARAIRDETALSLMNGRDTAGNQVKMHSNADIARATGLTTARIAQIRTGTR